MPKGMPQHLALIMDGNGRWAGDVGQSRQFGHRMGAQAVRHIVRDVLDLGIRHVTLFALSCDNTSRPLQEVNFLVDIFCDYLDECLSELYDNGVCVRFMGAVDELAPRLRCRAKEAEQKTRNNDQLVLTVGINFSGRWHVLNTTKKLLKQGSFLDDQAIEDAYDALLPSKPDLLIRTGGEQRLSDFVMYHLGYTELFFLSIHWPDFTRKHLEDVLEEYKMRDRRYGLLPKEVCDVKSS